MAIRKRGNGLEVDVQVTLNGQKRRYRETIHADAATARAFEARVRADLLDGADPAPYAGKASTTSRLPLEASLEKVWEHYWSDGGQARTVRSNMAVCVEFFGKDRDLAQITSADMGDFILWMKQRDYAPSTIRQKACVMSKAFRHFHERGNIHRIPNFKLPSVGQNFRMRVLTDEEFSEFLANFKGDTAWEAVWLILMDAGLRPSELRRVPASDLRGDLLTVYGKDGKYRTVPLTSRARRAFEEVVRLNGEQPFAFATPGAIRHKWDYVRDLMGLGDDEGFIPYALRHTCATRLYAKTRDMRLVQLWLGHSNLKMTERYAKLQPFDLQDARDLLEQ